MISPDVAARKSKCFSSSWWAVEREPDILDAEGELVKHGRGKRFVLLSRGELQKLAFTGTVSLSTGRVSL